MKKYLTIIFMLFATAICYPQNAKNNGQHVSLSIHESMLNNFFQSVGEVKGKGSKKVLGKKANYTWQVKNPKIQIESGYANFTADVHIKSGKIKTTQKTASKLDITYLKKENVIKIKPKKIQVDLKVKLFGKQVKLATLDLSKYYRPSFEFPGPSLNQKSIVLDKPDGSKKTLNIQAENRNLVIEKNRITVYSDLNFVSQ